MSGTSPRVAEAGACWSVAATGSGRAAAGAGAAGAGSGASSRATRSAAAGGTSGFTGSAVAADASSAVDGVPVAGVVVPVAAGVVVPVAGVVVPVSGGAVVPVPVVGVEAVVPPRGRRAGARRVLVRRLPVASGRGRRPVATRRRRGRRGVGDRRRGRRARVGRRAAGGAVGRRRRLRGRRVGRDGGRLGERRRGPDHRGDGRQGQHQQPRPSGAAAGGHAHWPCRSRRRHDPRAMVATYCFLGDSPQTANLDHPPKG